jgi:hypothetical protein
MDVRNEVSTSVTGNWASIAGIVTALKAVRPRFQIPVGAIGFSLL